MRKLCCSSKSTRPRLFWGWLFTIIIGFVVESKLLSKTPMGVAVVWLWCGGTCVVM